MEIKLTVIGGKTKKSHVLLKVPATIGRSRDADLAIAHPTVSRQHCRLFEADGLLRLRDMGSLNGTLVGGETITETPLRPNDEFTVGPVTFRVDYDYAGEVTAEGPDSQSDGMTCVPSEQDALELVVDDVAVLPQEPQGGPDLSTQSPEHPAASPKEKVGDISSDAELVMLPPEDPPKGARGEPAAETPALDLAPPDGQLPDFSAWDQRARETQGPAVEPTDSSPAAPQPEPQPTPPPPAPPRTDAPGPARSKRPPRAPSDSDLESFFNSIQGEGMKDEG